MWISSLVVPNICVLLVYTFTGIQMEETIVRPYAVTSFRGVENLYLQLRKKRIQTSGDSVYRICEKIFYVNPERFFRKPDEMLIDPRNVQKILKKNYRKIFDDLFKERRVKEKKFISLLGKKVSLPALHSKEYVYVGESKLREISIGAEKYVERVLSCLVQDGQSKMFVQYYVSENEYDVNEAPSENIIPGRFLFRRRPDNRVVVHAVAEEYTSFDDDAVVRVEELYLSRRETGSPTRYSSDDPICKLDRGKKNRLCRIVLMKLWSKILCEVITEPECVKRRISIDFHVVTQVYEEWMIGCRPQGSQHFDWSIHYVSRGYDSNQVFVHQMRGKLGPLSVQRFGSGVAVVSDPPTN